jgi:MFS family permease
VWTPQFIVLLVASVALFGCVSLVLPVLPFAVQRGTGRQAPTGIVTAAVALLTVIFELLTPRLLWAWRPRSLATAAFLVLAMAAAGLGLETWLPLMVVLGAIYGAAFGISVTVVTALVATATPTHRQAEGFGYYGAAVALPSLIAPPLALLLVAKVGVGAAFFAAAGCCLLGAITMLPVTAERPPVHEAVAGFRELLRNQRLRLTFAA